MKTPHQKYTAHRRAVPIVVAILITAAVSGYFMGLRQIASKTNGSTVNGPAWSASAPEKASDTNLAPTAVDYRQMPQSGPRPNSDWENHLGKLVQPPAPPPPAHPPTAEERARGRAQRAATRAYDGAPPTIPHPIDQISSISCLACHGEGAVIKDRVATKISHPHWASCTQCHVPSTGTGLPPRPSLELMLAGTSFHGAFPPPEENRAFPGAPPTIPHSLHMRNDCLSCHGPTGQIALRTTHPDRQNCLQCHAVSAHADQRILISTETTLEELWEYMNPR